jgi:hypothetical protein
VQTSTFGEENEKKLPEKKRVVRQKKKKRRGLQEEGRRLTNSDLELCEEKLPVELGTEASKKWPPVLMFRSMHDDFWLFAPQ